MKIRPVQSQRTDLLINTQWGIPKENLSKLEAKQKGLKYFKGYWVGAKERKQLKIEYNAYRSINLFAWFIIFYSFFLLLISFYEKGNFPFIEVLTFLVLISSSIGLFQYKQWARIVTSLALAIVFYLPLLPGSAPDKATPVLYWPVSIIGLYTVNNKVARLIFRTPEAKT